jgi:hypothetical protein
VVASVGAQMSSVELLGFRPNKSTLDADGLALARMEEATIRPAITQDARAIAEIHVAAWRSAYHGIVDDDALARMSVDEREERWTEILAGGESTTVAAERDGAIAGYCAISCRAGTRTPARTRPRSPRCT